MNNINSSDIINLNNNNEEIYKTVEINFNKLI
jgi:hypothetical protein